MNNNCYDTCELASHEYIDSAILDRWNHKRSVNCFLNSFSPEEIRGIACNLVHRPDAGEFYSSIEVQSFDSALVLSDYFRAWMVDNLKGGEIESIGDLLCVLYQIQEAYQEKKIHSNVA